jgi:hypothetical protein
MIDIYELVIEGTSPLLQCSAQNITAAQLNPGVAPAKKEKETPRQVAERLAYHHDGICVHPVAGIVGAITDAGAWFKDPKNARGKMKNQLKGALFPIDEFAPVLDPDTRKPYATGAWEVDVRTGFNNNRGTSTRIIICRPRFDRWSMVTLLELDDEIATAAELTPIIAAAGRRIGIGAFRPQRSGMFGRFRVECFAKAEHHEAKVA